MSNIIKFPTKKDELWQLFEKTIKQLLRDKQASDEMVDHIYPRLKQAYIQFLNVMRTEINIKLPGDFSKDEVSMFTSNIEKVVQREADRIYIKEILLDRLDKEIELYESEKK